MSVFSSFHCLFFWLFFGRHWCKKFGSKMYKKCSSVSGGPLLLGLGNKATGCATRQVPTQNKAPQISCIYWTITCSHYGALDFYMLSLFAEKQKDFTDSSVSSKWSHCIQRLVWDINTVKQTTIPVTHVNDARAYATFTMRALRPAHEPSQSLLVYVCCTPEEN